MKRGSNTRKLSMYLLIFFVSILTVKSSLANPGNLLKLLNSTPALNGEASSQTSQEQIEPYLNRSGEVYLGASEIFRSELVRSPNNSLDKTSFKGTHLLMSFFPEREIVVVVDSDFRTANNAISLGGHQIDSNISTFSMTITQEKYLITYQDLVNAVSYRVVGDVETGIGKVVEIDLKKLPPMYDSSPVIPPRD